MLTFMPAAAAVDEKAAKSVAFNRAGKCDSSKKLVPGEYTLESSAGEEEGESRRMIRHVNINPFLNIRQNRVLIVSIEADPRAATDKRQRCEVQCTSYSATLLVRTKD